MLIEKIQYLSEKLHQFIRLVQKNKKSYTYKIIEISKNHEKQAVIVKSIKNNIVLTFSPEEILSNNSLCKNFSCKDIKILVSQSQKRLNNEN